MISTISLPTAAAPLRAMPAFAKVDVYRDPAPILSTWAELETTAPCSIYQTRAFLRPWIATLGRKAGIEPVFILASAADGTKTALLCLGLRRHGPFRVAAFLGGKDSNLNLPLMRASAAWTATELHRLLRDAARALGPDTPDVFVLTNQPRDWQGMANPMTMLPHQASPSAAYGTSLPAHAERLFADRLSKDARKKLRKKETKLATLGPVRHRVAASDEERAQILDAFLAQKLARFHEKNIRSHFDTPEMRSFIEDARGAIELHALLAGERIVATYGGGMHNGRWSGMFNSFDAGDDEIARSSPGDLLLMRIMAKACAEGLTQFDLGIGQARYKAAFCDDPIPLFDAVIPMTPRGRIYAAYVVGRQYAKRIVKTHPRLMSLANRVGLN